jgi:hypothetical protein
MARHLSKARAIQNMLGRLGYHARPGDVVAALAECRIEVNEGLVEKVRMEIRKDTSGIRRQQARVKQVVPGRTELHDLAVEWVVRSMIALLTVVVMAGEVGAAAKTGAPPRTVESVWAGFNPRQEDRSRSCGICDGLRTISGCPWWGAYCRVQCEISGTLLVRDLDSRNGTLVNGQYIEAAHLLPGDRLTVGLTSFEVRYKRRQRRSPGRGKQPHVLSQEL